jgi:hypothetical protein
VHEISNVKSSPLQTFYNEKRRIRHLRQMLNFQIDQRLYKALLKDGLDEIEELEKEKLCLQEIHSHL